MKYIAWGLSFLAGCMMPSLAAAQMVWGGLIIPADRLVDMDTTQAFQYAAPATYQGWMDEIADCASVPSVGVDSVAWIRVPGSAFRYGKGKVMIGQTVPANHAILLIEAYTEHKQLVQHEMLHLLLWRAGKPYAHPEADNVFKACGVLGQ